MKFHRTQRWSIPYLAISVPMSQKKTGMQLAGYPKAAIQRMKIPKYIIKTL